MTMLLITKELAEAVVKSHSTTETGHGYSDSYCDHCDGYNNGSTEESIQHTPECIVTRAKLLLEQEWGIKS